MIAARHIVYFAETDKALLRAIAYFDVFNYPITAQEAMQFAPASLNTFSYKQSLEKLVSMGLIFCFGDFYSIQNNPQLVERRLQGNGLAEKKMKTARRYARLIFLFPFVRAVLLSGSISKGFMDEES